MSTRQLLIMSASAFSLLALPCQAGPCSQDIARMQAKIDAKLAALAAAGPTARQSTDAQLHRQPTPRSMAEAETALGQLPPATAEAMNDAMARARKADAAGDKSACDNALAEAQLLVGP